MSLTFETKQDHLKQLRRIEEQVHGLHGMVASSRPYLDTLTQISATTSALKSFSVTLLEEHVAGCVRAAAATSGSEADDKIHEATNAVARLLRS